MKVKEMSDNELIEFMSKLKDNPALLAKAVEVVSKAQFENGREAGIREVVEWVKDNATDAMAVKDSDSSQQMIIRAIPDEQWQAKLKSWNISSLKGEGEKKNK